MPHDCIDNFLKSASCTLYGVGIGAAASTAIYRNEATGGTPLANKPEDYCHAKEGIEYCHPNMDLLQIGALMTALLGGALGAVRLFRNRHDESPSQTPPHTVNVTSAPPGNPPPSQDVEAEPLPAAPPMATGQTHPNNPPPAPSNRTTSTTVLIAPPAVPPVGGGAAR
jgi:hypothetical protein